MKSNCSIALVAINSRFSHTCPALYSLRTVIRELPYDATILELSINDDRMEILRQIVHLEPQILVLSVYIWNKEVVCFLLRNMRKYLPNLKIVIGGPEVSYLDEAGYADYQQADYIILGAGEKAFRHLAETGFSFQERFIRIENYKLSEIPFLYQHEDIGNFKNKYIYYESSRGCPFRCSYCLSSRHDIPLEYRDPDKVKEELLFFIRHQIPLVKFIDRSFNVNKPYAREIWRFLIENADKTGFHFEIHPDFLDEEDIAVLKTAPENLFQFEIGIQSIHEATLAEIDRKVHWPSIKEKILLLKQVPQIHIHLDLIAGLPFENLTMLKQSLNEIVSLQPDHFQPGILKILHGTAMADKAEEYAMAYLDEPPYPVIKTKWLTVSEMESFYEIDMAVDLIYNGELFKTFRSLLLLITSDYYTFFETFAQQCRENGVNKKVKDRLRLFQMVNLTALTLYPESNADINDALLLDWGMSSQSHDYPDFLNKAESDAFKEEIWTTLKKRSSRGLIAIGDASLDLASLRKTSFCVIRSKRVLTLLKKSCPKWLIVNKHKLICWDGE